MATGCRKISVRRFFAGSVVLLGFSCLPAFSKDIRVSAFLTAAFSPDGTSVYYVQSDLQANVRRRGSFSLVYARNKEIRVTSEVFSIHKLDLATGKNETVATLQRPPGVGTGDWVPRVFWFGGESARMWWSQDGEIQYEVDGPTAIAVNEQGVRETRQTTLVSADQKWSYLPHGRLRPTLKTELKYAVFGSMELVTSWRWGDQGHYYLALLDHDHRTAKLLATGSDEDGKPAFYSYERMRYQSRVNGPIKDFSPISR
jgi:hypothetical protein